MEHKQDTLAPNDASAGHRDRKEKRLFRMFAYLSVSMAICWIPGDIFWTMYNLDATVYSSSAASTVALLMYCNAVTNPLLYQTGSNEIRRTLMGFIGMKSSVKIEQLTMFSSSKNRTTKAVSHHTSSG